MPITQYRARPGILDLGWGHPNPAALPVEPWLAATEATLRAFGSRALAYGYAAGPGPLVEWLVEHLRGTDRGDVTARQTFVTAGASHALELISMLLTKRGDLVLVDSPTYHLALRILADRDVEIVAAPSDREGIDPAATADLIVAARRDGRRVPMLYIVPTFANPTGRSLPEDRREALVHAARRTGVTIVEDDTYRELAYDGAAPASLWSGTDGGGPVVRIGSFAKTVAPGIRLGWINAVPETIATLIGLGFVDSGGGVNHANALTMATFGTSGGYRQHVESIRTRYAVQRDALVHALRTSLPDVRVPSPAGGWFSWLALPSGMSASAALPVAERLGVSFMEGSRFHAGGRGGNGVTGGGAVGDDHIRLSFSLLDPPDLVEAARRLGTAIQAASRRDAPGRNAGV